MSFLCQHRVYPCACSTREHLSSCTTPPSLDILKCSSSQHGTGIASLTRPRHRNFSTPGPPECHECGYSPSLQALEAFHAVLSPTQTTSTHSPHSPPSGHLLLGLRFHDCGPHGITVHAEFCFCLFAMQPGEPRSTVSYASYCLHLA